MSTGSKYRRALGRPELYRLHGRFGTLPSGISGRDVMICAWGDREHTTPARAEYQTVVPGNEGRNEVYAFCSERCQDNWEASPRPR